MWELYRWYIIGAIAVLLTQGALIGGLLVARTRQRRAEAEARRQRDDLARVLRVTTLSELTTSLAHEINQPLTCDPGECTGSAPPSGKRTAFGREGF